MISPCFLSWSAINVLTSSRREAVLASALPVRRGSVLDALIRPQLLSLKVKRRPSMSRILPAASGGAPFRQPRRRRTARSPARRWRRHLSALPRPTDRRAQHLLALPSLPARKRAHHRLARRQDLLVARISFFKSAPGRMEIDRILRRQLDRTLQPER